jgi:hypothetical protein
VQWAILPEWPGHLNFELLQTLVVGPRRPESYWFPNPFCPPQSGHCHVMPLQLIPHKFSCMQSMQMAKPHRHRQQKGNVPPQQWQRPEAAFRRRCLYEDSLLFNLKQIRPQKVRKGAAIPSS